MVAEAQKAGNTKLATYRQSVIAYRYATATTRTANFAARASPSGHRAGEVHGTS
jgi:hypothetical protein